MYAYLVQKIHSSRVYPSSQPKKQPWQVVISKTARHQPTNTRTDRYSVPLAWGYGAESKHDTIITYYTYRYRLEYTCMVYMYYKVLL